MARINLKISLKDGLVDVLTPNVRLEVRDYDIQGIGKHKQLWTDERGRTCHRYFALSKDSQDTIDPVVEGLERFADDLGFYAGVPATVAPDSSPDGLHVLTINNTDFYFEVGSGRYDGWGKAITQEAEGGSS